MPSVGLIAIADVFGEFGEHWRSYYGTELC